MKSVIIVGSARKDGDTAKLVKSMAECTGWDIVDLNDFEIENFDYEHRNADDDYLPLMRKLTKDYNLYVFVTPVYWYSMSGVMKVFFDRLTDLLTIDKETGRKLRGKSAAAVTISNGNNLGEDFWLSFDKTSTYLGMTFLGGLHTISEDIDKREIEAFLGEINQNDKG